MIDAKAAVMIGSTLAGVIALWAVAYGWGKWLNRPKPESWRELFGRPRASSLQDSLSQDARLERIERAVEAMAIELERLGEGQRYATKLLAERERVAPPVLSAPLPPSRAITPH
jgi:hypothetical protein